MLTEFKCTNIKHIKKHLRFEHYQVQYGYSEGQGTLPEVIPLQRMCQPDIITFQLNQLQIT